MWNDNASKIDLLFYKPYAKIIKEVSLSNENYPNTIGLFGSWGSGKSTIIELLNKVVEEDEKHVFVKLNAWLLESYEDAKIAVIESLLLSLQENKTFIKKVGTLINDLIKRINFMKLGKYVFSKGASLLPFIKDNSGIKLEEILEDPKTDYIRNIRSFRNDFENAIKKSNVKRIIVSIDDLDRCNPNNIIDILEAVKLFLSVKGTVFVIAIDNEILETSIKAKYNIEDSKLESFSKNYIEKMIQLPITIAKLSSKDVENYMVLLVLQLTLGNDNFNKVLTKLNQDKKQITGEVIDFLYLEKIFKELKINLTNNIKDNLDNIFGITEIASTNLRGNPRQTKRFLNEFYLKKKLSEFYFESSDLDIKVLAKLMTLSLISNKAFNELYKWNLDYDGCIDNLKLLVEGIENELTTWHSSELSKWLKTDPVDIYKIDLTKYFYLTKEKLNVTDIIFDANLDVRQEFEKISTMSDRVTLLENYIKNDLSKFAFKTEVYNSLIKRIPSDRKYLKMAFIIYIYEVDLRKDIENQLIKLPKDMIKLSDVPLLERMMSEEPVTFKGILYEMNIEENIKKKIME